jgi:hypothetical protein
MADAGRILIIPRGDYNANSTYDKLDLVKYKGTSWLAKKNATGVEPVEGEYWQKIFDLGTANNLTTMAEGFALDARQGKTLDDKITTLNNDLGGMRFRGLGVLPKNIEDYQSPLELASDIPQNSVYYGYSWYAPSWYPSVENSTWHLTVQKPENGSIMFELTNATYPDRVYRSGIIYGTTWMGWKEYVSNGKVYTGTATIGGTATQTIENDTGGKIFVLISMKVNGFIMPDSNNMLHAQATDFGSIIITKSSDTALQGAQLIYYYHLI